MGRPLLWATGGYRCFPTVILRTTASDNLLEHHNGESGNLIWETERGRGRRSNGEV